ncbi:MAG TPA: 50S ribosomal protein L17 [Anaerolineales bacterium]|nr:50S ribosomal protein L17 [Anaerolineales bacterium]
MRHKIAGYRLGRTSGARVALRRTLMRQLLTHDRIRTTRAKAQAIRGETEKIITIARNSANASDAGKVAARRQVVEKLGGGSIIKRLFEEVAPRFSNRHGGYTRMVKMGPRLGDAAEMVILELVEE